MLPDVDRIAHQEVSVRDNPKWRRPSGRPKSLCIEQVDRTAMRHLGLKGPWMEICLDKSLGSGGRGDADNSLLSDLSVKGYTVPLASGTSEHWVTGSRLFNVHQYNAELQLRTIMAD